MSHRKTVLMMLLAFAGASFVHADPVTKLGPLYGSPAAATSAARADVAQLLFSSQKLSAADRHNLGPLTAAERQALESKDKSTRGLKVGVTRPLSMRVELAGLLNDVKPNDGMRLQGGLLERMNETLFWTAGFRSEHAGALRLELEGTLPENARAYVYAETGEVHGPYTSAQINGGTFWTNTIYADEIFLEVQFSAAEASQANLRVKSVVHIESKAIAAADAPIGTHDDSCLLDVRCIDTNEFAQLPNAEKAVAQLHFVDGGVAYVCTGGLLNNTRLDGTPYLLTANHCFDSQTSATSLEATFQYLTVNCEDANVYPNRALFPRALGSTLLSTGTTSDYTLVQLNQAAPSNAVFLGWDGQTDYSQASGTTLYRLHHPLGATQFYARESVTLTGPVCSADLPRGNFIYEKDVVSGTAGGSSGSPLYLADLSVVGQLNGACGPNPDDDCDRGNNSVDGAFRVTFPHVQQWLAPSSGPTTCTPSTTAACMLNNRFKVEVKYRGGFDNNPADTPANVKTVTGFATSNFETGFFYFNSSSNIEMLIKILDQGNTDGQGHPTIAVLYGLATPLRVEVTVTDTTKGTAKTYTSAFGTMAGSTDFTAFLK
ncbi:MAG: trypsin-like peptidase domain-containing protein [Acidobacteria bacterium]|nr:trypsin-like peptidase domain-containing protein [Acidobacteriota bacterium]MBV9474670.1 trypsin-like peptidase domain-containing protein [Acidobacteriota bacterium]